MILMLFTITNHWGKRLEKEQSCQFFAFGEVHLFTITWHWYLMKITFLNWVKGKVLKILHDLMAETEYNREYVFINISPGNKRCCVFITLE